MKEKDASKRTKSYTVVNTPSVKGKREKTKEGKYKYTAVIKKSTPTKDKPGDTRLYSYTSTSARDITAERMSHSRARNKSESSPADSLSRADYAKLHKVEEPPKKTPKKRKKFFNRKKK